MRPITKGSAPAEFAAWLALANEGWQPTYDDLRGPEKPLVLEALAREQGWVCCYCERRISGTSEDTHIEHAEPQFDMRERALDFTNMRASCQGEQPTAPGHCGHLRGRAPLPVHPGLPNCTEFFVFEPTGTIAASRVQGMAEAASTTIKTLGLDIRKLTLSRRAAFDGVLEVLRTAAELAPALLGKFEARGPDDRFFPHGAAIAQYLRTLAA